LQPKTAISTEKAADDATEGEGSEQATTEGGGESSGSTSNLLAAHNPHDDEGEGEENEISVHSIRVRAYRMKKADAKGNPGWADLGFGE
jgi:nucleoporin NUP2